MPKTKNSYNDEFRLATVLMLLEGKTMETVCKEQGVSVCTLYAWKKKFWSKASAILLTRSQQTNPPPTPTSAPTSAPTAAPTVAPSNATDTNKPTLALILANTGRPELEDMIKLYVADQKNADHLLIRMEVHLKQALTLLRVEQALLLVDVDSIRKVSFPDISYKPLRDNIKKLMDLTTSLHALIIDLKPAGFNYRDDIAATL